MIPELYRRMATVRVFESRVARLYADQEIPGFVHVSVGQEAAAVGACWPLRPDDVVTSTHRGHGHCLAKGLSPAAMFAELMAKENGTNGGRGGSMHICDPTLGIFGANGIVGAGLPIAVGAAYAAQLAATSSVVVAFFGDGAIATGAFHEAVNLAAVWRLPVIFFCENNHYAEFSPAAAQHPVDLATRSAGYGLRHHAVDGNDVVAVADLMTDVVAGVRNGGGPVVVEAHTYRWHGTYEAGPARYRTPEELADWQELRDPLVIARRRAADVGVDVALLDKIDVSVAEELETALSVARAGARPSIATLHDHVIAPRPEVPQPAPLPPLGETTEKGLYVSYAPDRHHR